MDRYENEELEGLVHKRLGQVSAQRAPVDEVLRAGALYRERYEGWNVRHFYSFYRRRHASTHSYTWMKNTLQRAGLVAKAPGRGWRKRVPLRGMMVHQDGSTHQWVPGRHWDLIITLDDATSEHYSMFFVEEEGSASSFQGMAEASSAGGCPRACTPTAARTTGIRPKLEPRSTETTPRSSGVRCASSAWRRFPPIHRKAAGGASTDRT